MELSKITEFAPEIGLVLGSGLGEFAETLESPVYIPYKSLEGFPVSQVEGHKNRFVLGFCGGKRIIAMQGRFHYYEGYPQSLMALPIRIMKTAGVSNLILTNAAGGINPQFSPGDQMVITDHINMSGSNPLIGENDDKFGPRFPDMSRVYDREYIDEICALGKRMGIHLQKGVYVMASGPNYETPAEIRMFRIAGADAVGMSTVPEAISAAHCNMKIIGISCITNMAAGMNGQVLQHEEVIETANIVKEKFTRLLQGIIEQIVKA